MWLPDKLYELLPTLYGAAGLSVVYVFDTPIGQVSGILLVLTACLVWIMRRDYRYGSTKNMKAKTIM